MADLSDSRILITGGNGFIGSHLAVDLLRLFADVEIHLLDLFDISPLSSFLNQIKENTICHNVDITCFETVQRIVDRIEPSIVFHLGAYVRVGWDFSHVHKAIQVNIQGTLNLLHALEDKDFDSFVHTGTSEEYGRKPVPFSEDMPVAPSSPYSASKASSEMFCRVYQEAYGFPIVFLRPFNVYGEGQSPSMLIPEIIHSCLKKEDIKLTEGMQTREWNYVSDIVSAMILASQRKSAVGRIINIGSGEEHTIREIVLLILNLMGDPIKPLFGALPYRENEIWRMFCDNSLAKELLGWKPKYSLDEGLKRTIVWYKKCYEDEQRAINNNATYSVTR